MVAPAADDAALLKRLARGEAFAFRSVVDRYLSHLLGVARRMLCDDAEAEDVAQEALMRLWRNAGSLELGPGGLRPWLTRVTSNLCIDRIRASRNTSVVEEVPEQAEPAGQFSQLAEKDLARLRQGGGLPDWARDIAPFAVTLEFDDAARLRKFVTDRLFRARERRAG